MVSFVLYSSFMRSKPNIVAVFNAIYFFVYARFYACYKHFSVYDNCSRERTNTHFMYMFMVLNELHIDRNKSTHKQLKIDYILYATNKMACFNKKRTVRFYDLQ